MITKEDMLSLGFKVVYEETNKIYSDFVGYKKGDLEVSHQFKKVSKEYPNPFNFRGKYHINFRLKLETKQELQDILNKLR